MYDNFLNPFSLHLSDWGMNINHFRFIALIAFIYTSGVRQALLNTKRLKRTVVQEADNVTGRPALIADLSIRGVWQPQTVALLIL